MDATSEFVCNTVAEEKPLCWMRYNLPQGLMLEAPQRAEKIVFPVQKLGIRNLTLALKPTSVSSYINQLLYLFHIKKSERLIL